jgi:hypothetical protein
MPAEIVATEPTIEKVGGAFDEADGVAITGHDGCSRCPGRGDSARRRKPVRGISIRSDDKRTVDETTEQSKMPAQIVATEPWGG